MSRLFGRTFDLYSISTLLSNTKLCKYTGDNRTISWDEVKEVKEKIEPYLTNKTKDILQKHKIIPVSRFKILDNMAISSFPMFGDSDSEIMFPSKKAKAEYKRVYAYFLGQVLSNYNLDGENDNFGVPNEYDDVLPLLIEYMYLNDRDFDLKHLEELQYTANQYINAYEKYKKADDLRYAADYLSMNDKKYNDMQKIISEETERMETNTSLCLTKFSSIEGALKLIDRINDKEQFKDIIEELTLNQDNSRAKIMVNNNADSYGYRVLRKEIERNSIK